MKRAIDRYRAMIDDLEPGALERYDREESGGQFDGLEEYDQAGGQFTFSALDRDEQAEILQAIDENLPTRTTRPNYSTGTSYALKHVIERYLGYYVSNLQAKTAMRVLGYARDDDDLNPTYNVSRREWRAFSDLSWRMSDERRERSRREAEREYFFTMGELAYERSHPASYRGRKVRRHNVHR